MSVDWGRMIKQGWRMYSVHAIVLGTVFDGIAAIVNQNHLFAQSSVTVLTYLGVASGVCGLVGRFIPQESIN